MANLEIIFLENEKKKQQQKKTRNIKKKASNGLSSYLVITKP